MSYWVRLLLSLLILLILGYQLDFSAIDFKAIHPSSEVIILLILAVFFSLIIRSIRWMIIVNEYSDANSIRISLFTSFKYLLIGSSLNMILPSGSGEILKSHFASQELGGKFRLYKSSLYDKLIAIASLFFIALFISVFYFDTMMIVAGVLSLLPLILFNYSNDLFKIKFFRYLIEKLQSKTKINLLDREYGLSLKRKTVVIAFGLSVLGWGLTYYALYLCFVLCDLSIGLLEVLSNSPMLTLGRLFPLTLNGIGSDEALMTFLFKRYNVAVAQILLAGIVYRIALIVLPALFGLPFLIFNKTKKNYL